MTWCTPRKAAASALAVAAAAALAGCAGLDRLHAPRTVSAGTDGGAVTLEHGERLRIPLSSESGFEWRRVEPPIMMVVIEGAPEPQGMSFTPVRSGRQKLRLEYRPAGGGAAKRVVSYDLTVR